MGRQQVQPALRQAVQQQSANPKLQQQQQQQQQSKQQQSRPLAASTPVASKAVSRPQSAAASQTQAQVKQQPKQQQAQTQQLRSSNAQVYRPTPVKEHPDDAFLSGAWMFDQSRVPQWMASQLPTQQKSAAPKSTQQQQLQQSKQMKQQQQQQPVSRPTSSSSTPVKQQMNKNTINAQVYRPSPVKEHVDDAFNSGAWLFDESRVPQWLAPHLPKVQQQMQQRSATPKSAQTRPTSMPTQQQAAKPAVQQKQQQPVMQQRQQPTQPKQQKQLPTMQHGDDAFLWNGWTQASRQPLWSNSNIGSTTTSMKPPTMNAAACPQSPPAKQAQPQQPQGQKRPQSPARR